MSMAGRPAPTAGTPRCRSLFSKGRCALSPWALPLTAGLLKPAEAYAEARDIVDTIRDYAATMPIQLHRLRGKVTIIEGSGGDIAVLPCGRQVVRRCRRHRDAPAHLGRCQ